MPSHTSGSDRSPVVARGSRKRRRALGRATLPASVTAIAATPPWSGGLHLFPQPRIGSPPRDVAIEVRVRLGHRLWIRELERLAEGARRRPRENVRVPVAVVV